MDKSFSIERDTPGMRFDSEGRLYPILWNTVLEQRRAMVGTKATHKERLWRCMTRKGTYAGR